MKAYQKGAIAAVAALALTMSACQGGGNNPSSGGSTAKQDNKSASAQYNPQPRDNIKDGGTFTTAIGEITDQMNPWNEAMTTDTSTIFSWYNPNLFYYTPEGEWKFDPAYIVEQPKEEVKDNKTVVTYKINPKAQWNDGTQIDWTAFEAAWKACGEVEKDKFACNSTDGYNKIESVKKGADDKEVVVTFKQVFPWYKGLFGSLLYPKAADPEVFETGYTGGNYHPEWGAGPFKIEKIDKNEGIASFVRNEKWWGDAPKLDKRVFLVRQPNAAIQAFKNGELDAAAVANKDYLAQVKDMTTIDLRRGNTPSIALMTLNSESPVFKDIKVREATMRGIDRKQLMTIAFQGLDYTEEAPGSFTLYPYQKGYKDNFSGNVQFDAAQANKILDEAGYTKGSDGYRSKDGQQLKAKLPYFGDAALTKARVVAVQDMLKNVGINVELDPHPSSDFSKVIKEKSWDMMISGFASSDPFGVAYTCQIFCTQEKSGSSLNKSGTQNKEIDDKIAAMEKLPTADEQIAEANKIEEEALKTYGLMPLYNGPTIRAVKKGLANYGASVFYVAPYQDLGWQKD